MKMSDVFCTPLKANGNSIEDRDGMKVSKLGFYEGSFDDAAIHAINMHDELVEALETLIDDIDHKHCIRLESTIGAGTRRVLTNAIDTLNKAKD